MSLDHENIALVQFSLEKLRAALPPGDTRFYDILLRNNPEMRKLFRDDISGQGMQFMTTLAVITDALTTPVVLKEEVSRLADGHSAMGVTPAQFAPLGDALFDTFREVLGQGFTPRIEAAWRTAYAMIAAQMMTRMDRPVRSHQGH